MQEIAFCAERGTTEDTQELKLFSRYRDDVVCTVKRNPLDYLAYAHSLQKNLQFTLESPNGNGDLALRDLNIYINDERKISSQ